MKTGSLCVLFAVGCWLAAHAQAAPAVTQTWTEVDRGAHHRVWQTICAPADSQAVTFTRQTNYFTELQTGLHYRTTSGGWWPAEERFTLMPLYGAMALRGQHKAILKSNLADDGPVTLYTPGNQEMRSAPFALVYYDAATGKSVTLSGIQESLVQQVTSNQVIYPNAFADLQADVRYTYTRSRFEQDVILRQSPLPPADYGLDPTTTRLELWTEFPAAPAFQKTTHILKQTPFAPNGTAMAEPLLVDEELDFGTMRMVRGTAFLLGSELEETPGVRVAKRWQRMGGRDYLVESVEYEAIRSALEKLPLASRRAGFPEPPRGSAQYRQDNPASRAWLFKALSAVPRRASTPDEARPVSFLADRAELIRAMLPTLNESSNSTRTPHFVGRQPAPADYSSAAGLVLDYQLVNYANDFTFRSDTTYYVSGVVNLAGTTTLEGGAVIKFTNAPAARINVLGTVNCQAKPYWPVVLTAKDDDTAGLRLPGSSGIPTGYYGQPALCLETPTELRHIRVRYAQTALGFPGGAGYRVSHSQLVNCLNGIEPVGSEFHLLNVLLDNVRTNFNGSSSTGRCEHLTVDGADWLNCRQSCAELYLTNCLLVDLGQTGDFVGEAIGSTNDPTGIFESVSGGRHYLTADSRYRDAGITGIDAGLAADLKNLTTYAPVVLSQLVGESTTLTPQAPRDSGPPDLGYHYDPLDYVGTELTLGPGTLRLMDGIAFGVHGIRGINLQSGGRFQSEGDPKHLNRLVRCGAVQEQPMGWGEGVFQGSLLSVDRVYPVLPVVEMRFTEVSLSAGEQEHRHLLNLGGSNWVGRLALNDCLLHGVRLHVAPASQDGALMQIGMTNNLVQRCDWDFTQGNLENAASLGMSWRNNLFLGGSISLENPIPTAAWEVYDNLFDGIDLILAGMPFPNGYNGYVNVPPLPGGNSNVVLATFTYAAGPLGDFYQPSTDLIDAGSQPAEAAGLSHYTTRTNEVEEGASPVDIGLHYVVSRIETNVPPVLTVPPRQTIDELTALTVTNTATVADGLPHRLDFSLVLAPEGVSLNPTTGVLSWAPTEEQGPGTYIISVNVMADGMPGLSDTKSFLITVNEVNLAPGLTVPPAQSIDELTTLIVTNTTADADLPNNGLVYTLVSAPNGVDLDATTGVLKWIPTEAQGPSTNTVTVKVTDDGTPSLSDTQSFTVVVKEVNTAPVLSALPDQIMAVATTLTVTNSATDSDLPANHLSFALVAAPAEAVLDPINGILTWTPTSADLPSTNLVSVKVSDDGLPSLSDTQSFTVYVVEVQTNRAPLLTVPADQAFDELTMLVVTNHATDPDLPLQHLGFILASGPDGMSLDPVTGVLTWMPSSAQAPSTNVITVTVTDDGTPGLSDTKSFIVVVRKAAPPLVSVIHSFAEKERDANHREWQVVSALVNPQGEVLLTETNYLTELQTGMCFQSANGEWWPAKEEFAFIPFVGAMALYGRHKVILRPNLSDVDPVILYTPDNQELRTGSFALAYYDSASGQSVTLSEIKASPLEALSPNQVIYRDALANLRADLLYTYCRDGFEQDIILHQKPPPPATYGLDPATTRLQVWTEITTASPPLRTPHVLKLTSFSPGGTPMAESSLVDEDLDFGIMRMVKGNAHWTDEAMAGGAGVPIAKQWKQVNDRNYLVESVEYESIQPMLDALSANSPPTGVVLDYQLVTHMTNFTFQGDKTYYISGTVNLSGTTVLEGGAVIKYTNSPAARLNVLGTLDCQTTAYQPAIFTAKDDDTVGLSLPGSTGKPSGEYGSPAVSLDYPARLAHVRLRYAGMAMLLKTGADYQVSHAQVVNCRQGFIANQCELALRNLLLDHVGAVFNGFSSTARCEHLTVDSADWLNRNQACTALYLTNSLLVNVANTGNYAGTAVSFAGSGNGVFTTVGAGDHYLADDRYRNVGTPNIDPGLAVDLRQRTSYAPATLGGNLTGLTVLGPRAVRDTDVPDLGYHYEPLDYVCGELNLIQGSLVLTNGVAIGTFGRWGVNLQSGALLSSEGRPLALNHLVRFTAVQERPVAWGPVAFRMGLLAVTNNYDELPVVRIRFTDVSMLSEGYEQRHLVDLGGNARVGELSLVNSLLRGCRLQMRPSGLDRRGMVVALTNNLVKRAEMEWVPGEDTSAVPLELHLWNNLFLQSHLRWADGIQLAGGEAVDNMFAETTCEVNGKALANSYNAYLNTIPLPGSENSVVLTRFSFSPGPLGDYYQQSTDLIDQGSRLATAAGLPNYTTQNNQAQEGSSRVDIGLHYLSWNAATNADLPAQVNTAPVLTGPPDLIIAFPGTLVLTNRATDADLSAQRLTFSLVTAPDGMSLDSASGVVRWTPGAGQTPGTNLVTIRVADDGTPSLSDVKSFKVTVMEPGRLGYWRFDDTNSWAGENGQQPVEVSNVAHVPSFSGGALQVNNPGGRALIRYRVQETNGQYNTFPQSGSIRFVFRPAWTSKASGGTGPGELVRLWELGDLASPAGGAALSVTADGNNLVFTSKDDAGNSFEASGAYNFGSNTWYDITLGLRRAPPNAANRVKVTVFETTVISRDGLSYLPFPSADNGSFTIGSSPDGSRQARGAFDEWETVNYDFSDISWRMSYQAISARVSASPLQVNLRWRRTPNATTEICRKRPSETEWKSLAHAAGWSYTDAGPDLQIGQRYDYQLLPPTSRTGQSEITVGLNLPPVERRGRVILLVDNTVAASLSASLEQLTKDLVGEGWNVLRHDVPRHVDFAWYDGAFNASYTNNVAAIKALINADYLAAPAEVKAVFIIGHVTVPYAGANAEDGHVGAVTDSMNHYGAWPADAYYGDVDGVWTDQLVRYTNAFNPILQNLPGDGKWDANVFPSPLEIAVGRVDFARMPAFDNPNNGLPRRSEIDLLNQYLAKAHRYRNHLIALPERAVVMGDYSGTLESENAQIYAEAMINSTRCFGLDPGSVLYGDLYQDKLPALWGFQSGFASGNLINNGSPNQHSTSDLAQPANEPLIAFYVLDGSYFGDWDLEDNLLRAALATPNYGLVALYTRRGTWRLNGLALGDTFGEALLRTANDSTQTRSVRTTALLGDPTLRLKTTPAVAGLTAQNRDQAVALAWNPAADPNTQYLIYRSANPVINSAGDFVSLTTVPAATASFVDRSPPAGSKTYLVRPLNLVTTGSGSYTNLGPGAFVRVE